MVQRPSGNQSMQHANIVPSSLVKSSWVLGKIYPIIPGRLSFTAHHDDDHTNEQISRNIHMFYFSSDFHEHYEPYCADFGPVNLSVVYRFCELMNERMNDLRLKNRHLVYYSDENPLVQTNVAMLLASYVMLCQGWKAEQAVEPFAKVYIHINAQGISMHICTPHIYTHTHTHTHTYTHTYMHTCTCVC